MIKIVMGSLMKLSNYLIPEADEIAVDLSVPDNAPVIRISKYF